MKRPTVSQRAELIARVWGERCPDKTFFRTSLSEFIRLVAPSSEARVRIATLKAQLKEAVQQRKEADSTSRRAILRVVNGVRGDADEGEDGELLVAMGYLKHTVRSVKLSEARRTSARAAVGRRAGLPR